MHITAIIICIFSSCLINSLYLQLNTQRMLVQHYQLHWQNLQQHAMEANSNLNP
jgi:hypothetical protein